MLKVYGIQEYVSINGSEWEKIGPSRYIVTDENTKNELMLSDLSFDEACEILPKNTRNIFLDKTFFTKKTLLKILYNYSGNIVEYSSFDKISYKKVYEELDDSVSVIWLINHTSVKELIQYIKERI